MKPVKFHPAAECELAESVDFYDGRVPGLGHDFFLTVKLAARQIQAAPLRRPLRRDSTRQVKLPRFPYAVVYRDQPERIEIVAVAHGARRPGYWRNRL
jgi:plasmid stabilization system protein ParE